MERMTRICGRAARGVICGVAIAAALGVTAPAWAKPTRGAATRPAALPKPSGRLAEILDGGVPRDTSDLKAMEAHIRTVAARALRATVGVRIGWAGASGVIVTPDGYVLTAGHVAGRAGREVTVILHDGRRVRAKTLGANRDVDAGLIQITEKPRDDAGWPYCEMGTSASLKRGQWCLAAGHPGGYQRGRTAPVRLGRVWRNARTAILSDCTIVGGDSGGPLFDMAGKVIGVSSRIGGPIDANVHVPVDLYRRDWSRLVKAETWGGLAERGRGAYLGVVADPESGKARIASVQPGSPAEKAGIKPGDVVTRFADHDVPSFPALVMLILHRKPGDKVKITVLRGKKTLTLEAVLAKRDR
jgi:serine protease Do